MPKGTKGRAVCVIPGCESYVKGWGWCIKHYARWRDHGDPLWEPPSLMERVWAKVDRDGPVPEYAPHLGPCWIWTGALSSGYGDINVASGGISRGAHIVVWENAHGQPMPEGLEIDHLCRVKRCVNPDHLEAVTHAENMARCVFGLCRRGLHSLDGPNAYWIPGTTHRQCRLCHRDAQRRRRLARRLSQ